MRESVDKTEARRRFLRLVAGSPLLALSSLTDGPLERLMAAGGGEDNETLQVVDEIGHLGPLITSPEQAADVFDFVPVARKNVPPAHFGWLAGGVDDDGTMRANREGFKRFQIRPRRLVDVRNIDMSVRLFGTTWSSPIILAPVGGLTMYDPEGEVAAARAARSKEHLQILSTGATRSVEDVTAARGAPIWYQLYPTDVWEVTRAMVKRAEAAGCPVLVLTADSEGGANRETAKRFARIDTRQCSLCHEPAGGFAEIARKHPMYAGLDVSKVTQQSPKSTTWDLVKQLKDTTTMKLFIKGILTREDAQLAVKYGVDGVIVSNHGGRHVSTDRSTIESLPEVLEGAAGRMTVLIDSGFRRGTDVFKALALGANAICIGRAYVYGLAAFGQKGVETVLDMLRRELQIAMQQAGTKSIDKITRAYLVDRSLPNG